MSATPKLALASAFLVSSSALWQAFADQTMPVEVAVTRFAVVLVVSWVALALVTELAFPAPDLARLREAGRQGSPEGGAAHQVAEPVGQGGGETAEDHLP